MSSVESIFPEPSSTGIASQLSTLWSDLSTLASNANQVGAEQAVVGAAQSVATSISGSSTQLSQLASSLQSEVGSGADDGGTLATANSLLTEVAQLNARIVAGSAGGQDVNALSDESRSAVNQLASLLGRQCLHRGQRLCLGLPQRRATGGGRRGADSLDHRIGGHGQPRPSSRRTG